MRNKKAPHISVAIDCIVFGFDGSDMKLLLIQRGFDPERNKWSLMGGYVDEDESVDAASGRILENLTGLSGVYLEQLHTFGSVKRDTNERTISITYFALIDIAKYKQQLSADYHAEWFPVNNIPKLIFDHNEMVEMAKKRLQYKAALHPVVFELLPEKFTLPQIQSMYDAIYEVNFDKRNFSRKLLSTGLLIKLNEKDKMGSKKGAFYYTLDKDKYEENLFKIFSLIITPDHLQF
ncbi:NUDIX hydrolase [Mucilaginibacter terrae]|uniref:8-oxo-dGTP diphosphatase n=1 Tax=Mucilaginibacter terrae TaxID=1955052 RepID=A0ABU3GWS2_9SPHI|nr:NUDIX domain-containing protein [Mucilaginibacter terrae]MDT3404217.1 8-oxo-dGTP diphosphatase [Mucilaginibacter terrae]